MGLGIGYVVGCSGAAGKLSGADMWLVFVFVLPFLIKSHIHCSSSVGTSAFTAASTIHCQHNLIKDLRDLNVVATCDHD